MKKPYPLYKDSGVEWIGEIPREWKIAKVKSGMNRIKSKAHQDNPIILSLTAKGIVERDISSNEGQIAGSYYEYNVVKKGDLLLNPMDLVTNAFSSVSEIEGVISQAYFNLRCSLGYNNKYYDYYFKLQYWGLTFFAYGKGVSFENRWTLNSQTLMNYLIPYPSFLEQKQIASFLDHKTQLIDKLIEKTRQKIELLKEKRTSLINHCVTKGLNPDVEMKDSGVEWIGEIPRHWGLVQLKYLTSKVGSGVTPRGGSNVYCDEGITFLRSQNIHFHGLELDDVVFISQEIHEQMSSSKVIPNDVLFNITGASIGRCFYTNPNSIEYNVNQHVCIIRPNEMILTKFLYYCLCSDLGQIQISLNNTGSGKEGLNFRNIKSFVLLNINKNEQNQIVEYLDEKTQKIDTTIEKENKRIELLKEYRQSLISEVVTGKIDVRDEVAV